MKTEIKTKKQCTHSKTEAILGYGGFQYGKKCINCHKEILKDGFTKRNNLL